MFKWILAFVILIAYGEATSLKLKNDSPYTLRAVIRGSDNSYMGELVLNSQHAMTWTDVYGYSANYQQGSNAGLNNGTKSKTPYTVIWYCLDGGDYSLCSNVATGSFVTAQACDGKRSCQAKKEVYPSQPQGNYLQPLPPPPEDAAKQTPQP